MKILITGGAGFIGSAVVRLAISRGHSVVNVDALTYSGSLDNLTSVAQNARYIFEHVNINDRFELKRLFIKHKPNVVMHLAAESHVDRSIDSPLSFMQTNVMGTFNLLEASLAYWESQGCPESFRFHHISTDEVFGSLGQTGMFTETTPYDPRSPYAASKASSDHLVRAWHETYGLPVVVTNCSNNYGPYHFPEKLVPLVILNAISNQKIPIYGDGSNVRDWLYVDDHADALLLVIAKGETGKSYNISGWSERSNLELVTEICEILDQLRPRKHNNYCDLIKFVTDRPGHDARYAVDASRIERELGWKPKITLKQGLTSTVQWYLNNEDWWRPLMDRMDVAQRLGTRSLEQSTNKSY